MSRELRNALLSWGLGALVVFAVSQFLFHVTIPAGIARGQEREARDFAVLVFVIAGVLVFANITYWTYRLYKAPRPTVGPNSQSTSLFWRLLGLSILEPCVSVSAYSFYC